MGGGVATGPGRQQRQQFAGRHQVLVAGGAGAAAPGARSVFIDIKGVGPAPPPPLNKYIQGQVRARALFHQGPGFVVVAALMRLVLFHLRHVLGPGVAFTRQHLQGNEGKTRSVSAAPPSSTTCPPRSGWGSGDTHLLVRLLLLGHHSRLQGQLVPPSPPAHLGEGTELPPLRAPRGPRHPLHNGTGGTSVRPWPAAVRPSAHSRQHCEDPAPARDGAGGCCCRPRGQG